MIFQQVVGIKTDIYCIFHKWAAEIMAKWLSRLCPNGASIMTRTRGHPAFYCLFQKIPRRRSCRYLAALAHAAWARLCARTHTTHKYGRTLLAVALLLFFFIIQETEKLVVCVYFFFTQEWSLVKQRAHVFGTFSFSSVCVSVRGSWRRELTVRMGESLRFSL